MTKIELQTAIENEALQVCALEAELAELSDAFDELWLKHRDFIDMNRDLIGLKWLNDEDKENRAVSVTTDEYREMLNAAEETTEADDFDTIIRRMDYRHQMTKNLRARLELHREYLIKAVAKMKAKATVIP